MGSIPDLAQWDEGPVVPPAAVWLGPGVGGALLYAGSCSSRLTPLPGTFRMP